MNESQLDNVFDQLLEAADTKAMRRIVFGLTDNDLKIAYDHFFDLYLGELAAKADDDDGFVCQDCMKPTTTDKASEFFESAVSVIDCEIETRKQFAAASKLPN